MIDTAVLLLEGGLPSTAVAPIEILGSAGYLWDSFQGSEGEPLFDVKTTSRKAGRIPSNAPLSLQADAPMEILDTADLIIVSSGGADVAEECRRNASLIPRLRDAHRRGAEIAGVCSGVILLAEAGLLDGKAATTHWVVVEDCRHRFPDVDWQPERLVTDDGGVYCSGGVYSAVDLSLYLVEKHCGHQVAMQTARALLLNTPRTWQVGYEAEAPKVSHDDTQVREAQDWLFEHFAEDATIEGLASRVAMSPRNFSRRFKAATGHTPLDYLQRLRVNAARHLLEHDHTSVREVCESVGYRDVSFFRKLFKRFTGLAPQAYRERFGVSVPRSTSVEGRTPHH